MPVTHVYITELKQLVWSDKFKRERERRERECYNSSGMKTLGPTRNHAVEKNNITCSLWTHQQCVIKVWQQHKKVNKKVIIWLACLEKSCMTCEWPSLVNFDSERNIESIYVHICMYLCVFVCMYSTYASQLGVCWSIS